MSDLWFDGEAERVKNTVPVERGGAFEHEFHRLLEAVAEGSSYGVEFSNDVFEIHPYCWCEKDTCPQCGTREQPNFIYKPTGFKLAWYKYALRGAYMNQETTPTELASIIDSCLDSLKRPRTVGNNKKGK